MNSPAFCADAGRTGAPSLRSWGGEWIDQGDLRFGFQQWPELAFPSGQSSKNNDAYHCDRSVRLPLLAKNARKGAPFRLGMQPAIGISLLLRIVLIFRLIPFSAASRFSEDVLYLCVYASQFSVSDALDILPQFRRQSQKDRLFLRHTNPRSSWPLIQ